MQAHQGLACCRGPAIPAMQRITLQHVGPHPNICPTPHAPYRTPHHLFHERQSHRLIKHASNSLPVTVSMNGSAPAAKQGDVATLTAGARPAGITNEGESLDCADEAGGCIAPWDDEIKVAKATTVRVQLLESDPGLNQNLISSGTTVAQLFNQDMWERHRQPNRYWFYMTRMVHSTVLRRILRPCLMFSFIALVINAFNSVIPASWPQIGMSMVPHTLLGAALSLLLVFRTNSSFARFVEGRSLWGSLVRCSRNWTRLAATYFKGEMRYTAARYVQVLAFVLKSHLRAGRTRSNAADPTAFRDDPAVVVHELLPPDEADAVMGQTNKPFYMICRMTMLTRDAATRGVPRHVLLTLEQTLNDMLSVLGGCDRILGTPIPLSYTRHTSRSLVMWLASLPIGLWPSVGWLSVPSMFFISFIFLGIDEIGVEIEEPFCILPLLPMCRTIVNDVKVAYALS